MPSQLPPGWPPKSNDNHVLTAMILVLSLVLAIIICGFMIGCIVWRKKRRARARAMQDLEQKKRAASSSSYADDDSDSETEDLKRARSQQRMWSKATARWRANVRLSARRRRAQRSLSIRETSGNSASTSMASLQSMSSSTSVSRRNVSTTTHHDMAEVSSSPIVDDNESNYDTSRPPTPHSDAIQALQSALPSHPPAYPTNTAHSSRSSLPDSFEPAGSRHSLDIPSTEDQDRPSYLPSDAAHVATDDKGLLARMAMLASAPPPEASSMSYGSTSGGGGVQPSVPVLDEFEDMGMHASALQDSEPGLKFSSVRHSSESLMAQPPAPSYSHDPLSSPFPLPPAKSRLAAPLFYEYPSAFEEDVVGTEPSSEPSAPPFEAAATAPSAPPLDLDVQMFGVNTSVVPSAPPEDNADTVLDSGQAPSSDVVGRRRLPVGGQLPGSEDAASGGILLAPSSPSSSSSADPARGHVRPVSQRSLPEYLP